jgi:membrane dipeptidase
MQNPKSADTEAHIIHQSALILDSHVDTPQRFIDEAWDFTSPLNAGHLNLETARQGNLAGTFFALWAEPTQWRDRYAHRTLELLDGVLQQIREHHTQLDLCTSPAEILTARAQNKFAILLGIEGGHSIENSLALLRLYHQLGVRYMTLTWANSNDWADSSGDIDDPAVPHHNGLTPFGHQVIREMNRLGMIIDVSHASDKTFWDVLETTHAPILATHSSARALTNAPRNLTDNQLRAIAKNNGAVMVNFYSGFIDENFRNAINQLKSERSEAHRTLEAEFATRNQPIPFFVSNAIDRAYASRIPRPPLSSLIDHIDHIAKIAGIDHVGIGTDFDGISSLPEGIDSAADLSKITAALHARGYTSEQLHKILGGNLLRVFNAAQAAAPDPTPSHK